MTTVTTTTQDPAQPLGSAGSCHAHVVLSALHTTAYISLAAASLGKARTERAHGAGEEPAVDAVPVEHVVALTPGRVAFVRVLGIAIARRALDACSSHNKNQQERKRKRKKLQQ